MTAFDNLINHADSFAAETVGAPVVIRKIDGRRYECDVILERGISITDEHGAITRSDIASFLNSDWPYVDKGDELAIGQEQWTVHNEMSNDGFMTAVFLRKYHEP